MMFADPNALYRGMGNDIADPNSVTYLPEYGMSMDGSRVQLPQMPQPQAPQQQQWHSFTGPAQAPQSPQYAPQAENQNWQSFAGQPNAMYQPPAAMSGNTLMQRPGGSPFGMWPQNNAQSSGQARASGYANKLSSGYYG